MKCLRRTVPCRLCSQAVVWLLVAILASTATEAGTIGSGPSIVVDAPNGGETWSQRNFYSIRWVSSSDVTDVQIVLYREGSAVQTIAASTPSDGSFTWFVPSGLEPGGGYRVRVSSLADPAVYDESDGDFSIAPASQPALAGALILDGIDDYAEAADHEELDLAGGSFTVEAWVNFRDLLWEEIFIKPGAYALHIERMYSYPSWRSCMGIDYPCGVICCTSSSYLSLGWHHVALVYDAVAGKALAYYDGTQRCSATCSAHNSDQPLKVGQGFTGNALEGAIDELRLSSIARYTANFAQPVEPFVCDGSTRALWHFDELEGATVFHDLCGTTDNVLLGRNGAHSEGVPARRVYLPMMLR